MVQGRPRRGGVPLAMATSVGGVLVAGLMLAGCTWGRWPATPTTGAGPVATTVPDPGAFPVVAADGSGRYRTVQAAIDAVPAGNRARVVITIKPGVYREIVTIPASKPYVTLQGLGSRPQDVVLVNNHSAYSHGTFNSATVFIHGHDSLVSNVTMVNDLNEASVPRDAQAVALQLNADRSVLSRVRILGDQDTLLVNDGARSYIVGSYIEGTVDFIFGGGTAVFDDSDIHEKRASGGPITAASTAAAKAYGFLFYRSRIGGSSSPGTTTLGRPWRPDAQVLYRESALSPVIDTRQPWTDMSNNSWRRARFLEYRNTGPGAGANGNRPQLSDAQAASYTPQRYLAGADGWNPIGSTPPPPSPTSSAPTPAPKPTLNPQHA